MLLCVSSAAGRAQGSDPILTPAFIRDTVEATAVVVEREYFSPQVGARVASALREREAHEAYAGVRTRQELAERLTRALFALTNDKHLAVQAISRLSSQAPAAISPDSREARARRANYGVQRVEVLDGNVGYLNLTAFFRPDEARDAVAAAMALLRPAGALILDMRENGGGSPDTAALLMSYLFEEEALPLFAIVSREGKADQHTTASPAVAGRNGTRPVYVLTSAETFSAGEGVAFVLQERGRAEVIGERTAGAANPGRAYPVNEAFEVTVPNGQVRTALSGRNWEGHGVAPDILVPAPDALRTAHARALLRLDGGV